MPYKNGYEPRIGDKVRRLTENTYPHKEMVAGSEWQVVQYVAPVHIVLEGKPNVCWVPEHFDLISRAVRYSDGNDAAVGDLVEVGKRYEVTAVRSHPEAIEGGLDLKPDTSGANCGLRPIRFKLIARACPYKVGDWVHSLERQVEFQVSNVRTSREWGWSLDGEKQGCFSWNVASLKPGRLPPQPAPQPLSVADEVRAIMTEGDETDLFNRRTWKVVKLTDLINAKTERLEKLVLELNRKIVNQRGELSAQNATCRNYKTEIDNLRARVQSLTDIAANKEKTIQGLFDQAHRRTAEIDKLQAEVRSKDDALQNAGGRNRALEENIARERSRNVQLHDELRTLGDYKVLYENLRNKLREVAE